MRKLKNFLISLFVLILLAFAGGGLWWIWASSPACATNCESQILVINKGESVKSVAARLEKQKLIRSAFVFEILVDREGLTRKIQAGDFRIDSKLGPLAIAQELTHGTLDRWVMLPEGLRREEVADKIAAELNQENDQAKFDKAEFLSLTKNLEGQLFPDTYLLPKDVDAQRVVIVLTNNFKKKTSSLNPDKNALILASIVEREAKYDADRPIVAGILLKRLVEGWPLQVDAAVQYAVGDAEDWWPNNLTKQDLQTKSPYNTYLFRGLPPGPISNPGLAAIKAALQPQETDYWYYLTGTDGKMHYAKTIEEHNANIANYLK